VSSGDSTDNDFVDEPDRLISGQVLNDTNNDDSGDIGLSGVTVTLVGDTDGDTTVDTVTTTTSSDGRYTFTGLEPGDYTIIESTPDGYNDVTDSDGGDANTI